jgi:hypothetical protein
MLSHIFLTQYVQVSGGALALHAGITWIESEQVIYSPNWSSACSPVCLEDVHNR